MSYPVGKLPFVFVTGAAQGSVFEVTAVRGCRLRSRRGWQRPARRGQQTQNQQNCASE